MENIKHLFNRAGFGLSLNEWLQFQNQPIQNAIDHLFNSAKTTKVSPQKTIDADSIALMDKKQRQELFKAERQKLGGIINDWLERMASPSESQLLERMSLFWHGHFACTSRLGTLAYNQINSIRKDALGNFRDLITNMAKDPSMIRFLNNQQNRKQQPNENFARELLELFTVGRGKYSEKDIKEAARAFTGWSSNKSGQFVFRPFFHDYGEKKFFGKSGNFDGTDIIDIILENRATARFITEKVYRYFVNRQINEDHLEELSQLFYDADYEISVLMRSIFESDWFYENENRATKIKSPIDLVAGIMRTTNVTFPDPKSLVITLKALGQVPFNPPNVAGWPGGQSWIDNATLMLRLNLPFFLMDAAEVNFKPKDDPKSKMRAGRTKNLKASIDLGPIEAHFQNEGISDLKRHIHEWLIQTEAPIYTSIYDAFIARMSGASSVQSVIALTMAQPEFQLC